MRGRRALARFETQGSEAASEHAMDAREITFAARERLVWARNGLSDFLTSF